MKILAIRIRNLASLEGSTEIDFSKEPLSSAGIFAITGPTGAGKSTILDALCLALYAKAPRYRLAENGIDITDIKGSTIKQDDVRGILRDGTPEGFAEVDFEGIDGQHYRTNWSVRRARNKADGNLQPYEMSLKNISTHQDIPGRKTELLEEIERLIGLNYEQFTRSVLLAQGDFTAFLKAGKDEKSSLLEKLTGTHIYSEISKRIFENHREQQQKLLELNLRRQGIMTLTSEELTALQEQQAALTASAKINEEQIEGLRKEITWHEQCKKLQESIELASKEYEQANTNKVQAEPREKYLQKVDRIQPVKPIINRLQNAQEEIASKSKQIDDLNENLEKLKEQKNALEIAIEKTSTELKSKIKEEEDALPLLNKAKELDVQLSENEKQVKQAIQDSENTLKKQDEQKKLLLQIQKESDLLEQEISNLNHWKTDNENRRPIAEHERIILSKLSDAERELESLLHYATRMLNAEKEIKNYQQRLPQKEKEREDIRNSIQQVQKDFNALQTDLSKTSIQEVEQDKAATDLLVTDIVSATAHWKLLYNNIKENEVLQKSLEQNQSELKEKAEKQKKTNALLEVKKAERNTFLKALNKARLVAAENIEQLRDQLVDEEPCPVCGSTEHPFVSHNPVVDNLLNELEKGYNEAEANYADVLAEQSSINEACIQINKNISAYEENISTKTEKIQELDEQWMRFSIYEKGKTFSNEEKTSWLEKQLIEQKEKQQQLREQIQSYGKKKTDLEIYKTKLSEHEKKLISIEADIKDIEREQNSLAQRKNNDDVEHQKANSKLENLKQTLSLYFSSEQWFQNWQTDPETFSKRITSFAEEWKQNIEKLNKDSGQQSVLKEKLNGVEAQFKNTGEEVKQKEQKLSTLQNLQSGLSDERNALFNGELVNDVEKRLKSQINLARIAEEKSKLEVDTIKAGITKNVGQSEQLGKDKAALEKQETEFKTKLTEWLDKYNQQYQTTLTEIDLSPLLEFSHDWMEAERISLQAIKDTLTQSKSLFDERKKELETHKAQRITERTLEALTELYTEERDSSKANNQKVSEISFRINEDEANKKRIGLLLKDIEKQASVVENWAKLNEVIGSADGKKFRQIAQEYTLDILLSYANVHLELLSKRYILQRIPNSLGLQVLDQDMGDEVRTVYSLSGGESFLVSLALALGLASLSSSRMKVESLFIDEGFGSLDPTTLNIAMDALERLHNQGRKVGVISHVQEMTERIPVQIKVSKQQSGKSKVEVIGF